MSGLIKQESPRPSQRAALTLRTTSQATRSISALFTRDVKHRKYATGIRHGKEILRICPTVFKAKDACDLVWAGYNAILGKNQGRREALMR